jgi:hypothetical protein
MRRAYREARAYALRRTAMAFVKHFEEIVMEKVPANEGN